MLPCGNCTCSATIRVAYCIGPLMKSARFTDMDTTQRVAQHMKLRPTLTTTTDPALLDAIQVIQTNERRTRASVVEELLSAGLAARRSLAGVRARGARRVHAQKIHGARS